MEGLSRQMIAGYISMGVGIFTALGVELSPETKMALLDNIEGLIASGMALYGLALVLFRKITSSPMIGWLTKRG